jgi:hypothetical protein
MHGLNGNYYGTLNKNACILKRDALLPLPDAIKIIDRSR